MYFVYTCFNSYKTLKNLIKQVRPDGQCMFTSALPQFLHHKEKYTTELLQRQLGLHLLKHAHKFYPYVQQCLEDSNESYESFCVNVFQGNVWGDDFLLAALGHMFNVAVSLISPCFEDQYDLFHDKKVPDIVVIANGGNIYSPKPCTHFSGTRVKTGVQFKFPGSEMVNPKLDPVLFSSYQRGKDDAIKHYMSEDKEMSLIKLRGVARNIERMDSKIVELIGESDKLLKKKQNIEHRLECLGVDVSRIEKAGHVKERGYVRTHEQKQQDEARVAAEQIAKEAPVELGLTEEAPISLDLEDDFVQLLTTDQLITATPELPTTETQAKIDIGTGTNVITINEDQVRQQRVNQMALQVGLDPALLRFLPQNQGSLPQSTVVQNQPIMTQTQPTMTQTTMPTFLQPNTTGIDPGILELLQQNQQVVTQTVVNVPQTLPEVPTTETLPIMSVTQVPNVTQTVASTTNVIKKPAQQVLIPRPNPENPQEQLYVLQTLPEHYVKAPHSRTEMGSVPKSKQDDNFFYCNRCPHFYTTRSELLRHRRETCLKTKKEFICPKCFSAYYYKWSIREHYYAEHLKQILYRCPKCGKEFYYKSRRSTHKRSCPKMENPDTFEDTVRDPEIEKLFVKKAIIAGGQVEIDDVEITGEEKDEEKDGGDPTGKSTQGEQTKDDDKGGNIQDDNSYLSTLADVATREEKMDTDN